MTEDAKSKLSRHRFSVDLAGAFKRQLPLIFLIFFALAIRILLIQNAPFIYHFDSYAYVSRAIDLVSQGTVPLGAGMPFIFSLAAFILVLGPFLQTILIVRLLMLLVTSLTVAVVYLLGTRMVSRTFGFLAALLASFEPFFLTYSIVPHNDVFAVAMGLTALYLATSRRRISYVSAPIFFFLAVLTRPEFFIVFAVPIVVFYVAKAATVKSKRSLAKVALAGGVYILPVVWVYLTYSTYTRFGLFEKLNLFLTPSLLQYTVGTVFDFYDNVILNDIFLVFVAIGLVLTFLTIAGQFIGLERNGHAFSVKRKEHKRLREMLASEKVLIVLCVLLVFVIHIVVLTVYGIGYVIIDGTVVIKTWFPDRYMVLSRILIYYPLVYSLALTVQGVRSRIGSKE